MKWWLILSEIWGFSIATQRILVESQIWTRKVKERLKLHNLRNDHVVIRSELKYIFGAKMVNLKCRVFGGKTALFPMVRVFRVVRPVAKVQVRVEPDPELTRQFGPFANTTCYITRRRKTPFFVLISFSSFNIIPTPLPLTHIPLAPWLPLFQMRDILLLGSCILLLVP